MDFFGFMVVAFFVILIVVICSKSGKRKPMFSAPVTVTTTTVPGPLNTGYPAQQTIATGYPVPQPQPGYAIQPYPHGAPYPMAPSHVDYNPPSYDQVMHGGEAYQTQAPYNPAFTGKS